MQLLIIPLSKVIQVLSKWGQREFPIVFLTNLSYIFSPANKQDKRLSSMANHELNIVLPGLTVRQGGVKSTSNIRGEQESHHFATSQAHKKWTLNESYVERRISHKKQKLLKPLDPFNTPKAYNIIGQSEDKNMFFTGVNNTQEKNHMEREQLRNFSIEKSKKFVEIVKSQRKKLLKIRMITEPKHKKLQLSTNTPKDNESNQLFNYLRRSFINEKKQHINNTVIERFKTQSPQSIFEKISEKSRKFLLDKMQKDYKNHIQIDNYKQQQIKNLIQQQIEKKKKQFRSDYSKRYSSPYFYFLSLSKEQKSNILKRQHLNSLNSI